jgi:hypothetical protein
MMLKAGEPMARSDDTRENKTKHPTLRESNLRPLWLDVAVSYDVEKDVRGKRSGFDDFSQEVNLRN